MMWSEVYHELSWIRNFQVGGSPAVMGFYDRIRLYYPYDEMRRKMISMLNPLISDSVRKYSERKQGSGPSIYLTTAEDKDSYEDSNKQNVSHLQNALEFVRYACSSPESIQPILFYYSWLFFAAFFANSLFRWESHERGHGMSVEHLDSLKDVEVRFRNDGALWRLVDCLTVLGIPTICGRLLPIPKNSCLEYEETNDLSHHMRDSTKLSEILQFNVKAFCADVNQRCDKLGLPTFGPFMRHINEELRGYILVFVASNIARYRPLLWRTVVEGSDEMAAKMNDEVNDAYSHYVRGTHLTKDYVDPSYNFMNIARRILELTQNDQYLKQGFKGTFTFL